MADLGYGDDEATLGDRLTHAREAAGLSLQALAAELSVRIETVQQWEADQDEPRAAYLDRLSGLLNVSLRWLLTGRGAAPQSAKAEEGAVTELRELHRLLGEARQRLERLEEMLSNA